MRKEKKGKEEREREGGREGGRKGGVECVRERENQSHLFFYMQASLCTVDIDCGKVEFPDELPCLPNEDRLLVQVSEKLHQHNISCSDMVDLPHSPDSTNLTPRKPSIIEAIRYMYMYMQMLLACMYDLYVYIVFVNM